MLQATLKLIPPDNIFQFLLVIEMYLVTVLRPHQHRGETERRILESGTVTLDYRWRQDRDNVYHTFPYTWQSCCRWRSMCSHPQCQHTRDTWQLFLFSLCSQLMPFCCLFRKREKHVRRALSVVTSHYSLTLGLVTYTFICSHSLNQKLPAPLYSTTFRHCKNTVHVDRKRDREIPA